MVSLISITGWLICDEPQLHELRLVLSADNHPADRAWGYPGEVVGWLHHAFYAAEIPAGDRAWFETRLRHIAAIAPADPDGDRIRGYFLIRDDESPAENIMTELQVRDGTLVITPANLHLRYLGD